MRMNKKIQTPSKGSPKPCIVCDRAEPARLWEVLLRCKGCGHVYADLDLDASAYTALYDDDYFMGEEYGDYLADEALHRRNFERRYQDMVARTGRPRSVFEIGCAYGFWLDTLAQIGVPASGIDVCEGPVRYAVERLGQQAHLGSFLERDMVPGEHDVFCMWDTVEHLPEPELFIQRASDLLPSGGWLFMTTGDIGATFARLRGRRWRMIHPPTHVHYFSRGTMRQLLERHGFEAVEFQSAPVFRNLRSVLSTLAVLGSGAVGQTAEYLATTLPVGFQEALGVWTNLGDIMMVGARRR